MNNSLNYIQKSAMLAVAEPDNEAFLRHLYRWYSKHFYTPLHEVEDLPTEFLLQHYFETIFEEMDKDDRHNQIIYLLETPEERREREFKEKNEEDEFYKAAEAEAESQIARIKKDFKKVTKELSKKSLKTDVEKEKEIIEKLPEEIKIKFVENEEFNEMSDGDFIPNKH